MLHALVITATNSWALPLGPCHTTERRRVEAPLVIAGGPARPPSIGSTVHPTLPVRVHWNRPEDEAKVPVILETVELSWRIQVDELGFPPPVLPDSADGPELDIYLATVGAGTAFVDAERYPMRDVVPGDGRNGTPVYMAIDQGIPADFLPVYVAHEFQHTTQFATDFTEYTLPIWEGVATAAQAWTLGEPDSVWDYDVYSFQQAPWAPTLIGDSYVLYYGMGVGATYEYGAALWVMHLDQLLGDGDGARAVALWAAAAAEGPGGEPDVLEALVSVTKRPLPDFLNGVARSRWLTGDRWDPRGLPRAASWGRWEEVPSSPLSAAELAPDTEISPRLHVFGQAFYRLDPAGSPEVLRAQVSSAEGTPAALLALWWAADGSTGELTTFGSDPTLDVPLAGLTEVVLAVTNLGPADFDDQDNPYRASDHHLLLELVPPPPIDSGSPTDTGRSPGSDSSDTSREPGGETGDLPDTATPGETGAGTPEPDPEPDPDPSDTSPTDPPNDAGELDSGGSGKDAGCGCQQGGGLGAGAWLTLLALRRRRYPAG